MATAPVAAAPDLPSTRAASETTPGLGDERVANGTLVAYAAPILGVGVMWHMIGFYFLKYATDVLLLAPALVGGIFAAARVWDAVSDPLAGYWSDRTRSRLGRRRSWMLASALPLAVFFAALWNPPSALSGSALAGWVAAAFFLFYTALTAFRIPHLSLGAELARGYHDRTRLFSGASFADAFGGLLGVAVLLLVLERGEIRATTSTISLLAGAAAIGLIVFSVARLREPMRNRDRGARGPWQAFGDVRRNPHARRMLWVVFLPVVGLVCGATTAPYGAEYLMGDPARLASFLGSFAIAALVGIPCWAPLSRRFGKRPTWMAARALEAVFFSCFFFIDTMPAWAVIAVASCAGFLEGGGGVLLTSLEADVIDYDEARTGERKEGTYFAVWSLTAKTALSVAVLVVGVSLEVAGFEPGVAQSDASRMAIRLLMSVVPAIFLLLGVVAIARFDLDEQAHRALRLR